MSLVDLPGMTRVPVQGQPENIASKLRALIMSYISNPSCIILAVSAANADLANSDAIALAREADPEGARTIGAQLAPCIARCKHSSAKLTLHALTRSLDDSLKESLVARQPCFRMHANPTRWEMSRVR